MGLDVYLYKCDDLAAYQKWEEDKEAFSEEMYAKVRGSRPEDESLTDAERDEWMRLRKVWEAEHPQPCTMEQIENDSKVYPEHMFKIGYLRSSYNDNGINSVLRNRTGKDLYYVFFGDSEASPPGYRFAPDWPEVLKRARDARDTLAKYLDDTGPFTVIKSTANMYIAPNELAQVDNEKKAMDVFMEQYKRDKAWREANPNDTWRSGNYSNRDGQFMFGTSYELVALIEGADDFVSRVRNTVWPATYAIVRLKPDKDGKPPFSWHKEALEIVAEMCEFVLAQTDAQKYFVAWSS